MKKENGSVIYSSPQSLSSGFLYSWVNDCTFQNNNYEMCDGVQNLEIESEYPVIIKWDAPASDNALYYEIYRDTRFMGTTEDLEFNDATAIGTFSYEYSVRPIYNDCSGHSSHINIEHISGEDLMENISIDASVYPNPSRNDFTVTCENMTRVSVYNIMGAMIFDAETSGSNYIISDLNAGVYFISIETNNGSTVRKVVKL